jgi:hypothetical protein
MKFEFSEQIFRKKKNSDIKSLIKIQRVPNYFMRTDRRTDENDEANSRFCQICERA